MHYGKELERLAESYAWARTVPLGRLLDWKEACGTRPLLAIGSGGSLAAAHFAALLHRRHGRHQAKHLTPYELLLNEPELSGVSLMLLSASGDNADILSGLDAGLERNASAISALCMKRNSPLAHKAQHQSHCYIFEDDIPTGKDGFLATNTLMATLTLLARAYGAELLESLPAPPPPALLSGNPKLLIQIVYGGWAAPVATDLESKLNESGLGSAAMNDYRNFAHGRQLGMLHHWQNSLLIALVTPETAALAERTLACLPPDYSKIQLSTHHHGPAGTLDLWFQALYLVKAIAASKDCDPARMAQVPDWVFGMYKLSPHSL